jgi:hypothetical protein
MLVAPIPVFFLFVGVALIEFAMVAVRFMFPLDVKCGFVVVPAMIVVVIGVVDAICVVFGAACDYDRRSESGSQEKRRQKSMDGTHGFHFLPG